MPQRVEGNIEIEAPVETVYSYWETLENLPQFMANVQEVTPTGPDTTHWRVKGPFGKTLEWEAQTTQKEHNSAIAWNSTQGEVGTSGQVRFLEAGQPGRTRADPGGGTVELLGPAGGQGRRGGLQGRCQPQAPARAGPRAPQGDPRGAGQPRGDPATPGGHHDPERAGGVPHFRDGPRGLGGGR